MYRGQRRLIGLAGCSAIRVILFICITGPYICFTLVCLHLVHTPRAFGDKEQFPNMWYTA